MKPFCSGKRVSKYFDRLGAEILERWSRADLESRALPQIASACLHARNPSSEIGLPDLLKWVLTTTHLPVQADIEGSFGQPPLTVYSHPRFRIEVLCWHTATTSIHQHSFSGAFTVLQGSSIQSHYRFTADDRVNDYLQLGTLALEDMRLLEPGDVEPIESGDRLVHAVYHLDTPTLSLVVRTHGDPEAFPQFEYYMPGLAVDPFYRDPLERRRAQLLRLLALTFGLPNWHVWAAEAIEHSTLWGTLEFLQLAADQWGDTSAEYRDLVQRAEDRHGARARRVAAAVAQRSRMTAIHQLRGAVRDPRHRLFLSAALYSPNARVIVDFIRRVYPNEEPADAVVAWIKDLVVKNVISLTHTAGETILSAGAAPGRAVELIRVTATDGFADLFAALSRTTDAIDAATVCAAR